MTSAIGEYVVRTAEGVWRVAGSRVSLDSIVHAYWEGSAPESIVKEFPTLTTEQVYGAIAFYLRHQSEIDCYLDQQAERWQKLQQSSNVQHSPLLDRLHARRPLVDDAKQPS